MMKRPDRIPRTTIISPVVSALWEHVGNWQVVYAGGLADHRALEGAQGVYTVKVLPPLRVTDDGIAIDLTDPVWGMEFHRHCYTVDVDISGVAVPDPLGVDRTPGNLVGRTWGWMRGWNYEETDTGLINPAIPWPLCLNEDIDGGAGVPNYGHVDSDDVTPTGACDFVLGTHYIDATTGEWNVLVPLPAGLVPSQHSHCMWVGIAGATTPAEPTGADKTPSASTTYMRGWNYTDDAGDINPAMPWPLCLSTSVTSDPNPATYGEGSTDVTPTGACQFVRGTHFIDGATGLWNPLIPLPATDPWPDPDSHEHCIYGGELAYTEPSLEGSDLTTQATAGYVWGWMKDDGAGLLNPVVPVINPLVGGGGFGKPPVYANNAAAVAGGLACGDFYRTGGDPD